MNYIQSVLIKSKQILKNAKIEQLEHIQAHKKKYICNIITTPNLRCLDLADFSYHL